MYFQKYVIETITSFDIVYARMLKRGGNPHGPFDIALIEGTITESWQVDELKKIREQSKQLFAIGSCAIDGGIPAIKSTMAELDAEKKVYKDLSTIHSIRPHSVDAYVKVDGYIRGCPPGERDLHEALASVLTGKKPAWASMLMSPFKRVFSKRPGVPASIGTYKNFWSRGNRVGVRRACWITRRRRCLRAERRAAEWWWTGTSAGLAIRRGAWRLFPGTSGRRRC